MSLFDQQLQKEQEQPFNKPNFNQQTIIQQDQHYKTSIVEKFNIIQAGINFLVPHIWYQYEELCKQNFRMKQLKQLCLPAFSIKQILTAYNYIQLQEQYSNNFQNVHQKFCNVLSHTNFATIETYQGIKMNKFYKKDDDFFWKLINPQLWRIIQQKNELTKKQQNFSLSILIQEEFLKNNKSQLIRGAKKSEKDIGSVILFRNKFYLLQDEIINKYILQNIFFGQRRQILICLIQQEKRIQISGYFNIKTRLKSLILSLKKSFNFKENLDQIFKGNLQKLQLTRLTTLQNLDQGNNTLFIFCPNFEFLNQKFQNRKLSFQNFLKSNLVEKAYSKFDKQLNSSKKTQQSQKNFNNHFNDLSTCFKLFLEKVQKNKKNHIIKESEFVLRENLKRKLNFVQSNINSKRSDLTQEQAIFASSEGSGADNRRNIRSVSTQQCTQNSNLSYQSQRNFTANQYRKIVKDRLKRKKNKKTHFHKENKQKSKQIKNRFQFQIFNEASMEQINYYKLIARQSIFNEKCHIRIPKQSKQQNSYNQIKDQLSKLIQYFQKSLQVNQLSKDLYQQMDLQKRQMQRLSKQKMKQEELITIGENQMDFDFEKEEKNKQRYYFDKEEQLIEKEKRKIKTAKKNHLISSRISQKVQREDERIEIQTQTQQIQFYSDEQRMLDEDQQVI